MPALEATVGAYCGVTTFKRASNITDTTHDREILDHLLAASREIDRLTLRRYFPVTGTNKYRWPPLHVAYSWEVWTLEDLLSVSAINVADSGVGAVPVAVTHYFLEPQYTGPPYNRVEIDLSSTDVLQAGPTPQQSVAITGQWGYSNATGGVGSLSAQIVATDTTLTAFTGNTLASIEPGDVLLIESEAIFVDLDPGNSQTVLRRGVNGTTAATHASSTAVAKYQAPSAIRRVVRADAIGTFQQDLAAWGRTIGAGDMTVEYQGKQIKSMRQQVVDEYRRARTAAI